ncbi:beta-galactoside alpha-2,6-sialyltransferase 2 [Anthonomus grandis grandis]|uniref:beta-galactoside alpha-2,6-sialyltransferase 2 n=1 Tax=Anthonomus grandis grandis TaxID=2921223 RepID=UPI002165686A|nr:beta-galactoside alpha-2,6-sialyltransferase 2 [Anthonomus grandis grandis]
MRCTSLTNTIFINLIIFSLGVYFYTLWTKYDIPQKPLSPTTSTYDRQIYLYNRGLKENQSGPLLSRQKHHANKPMFPSSNMHVLEFDSCQYCCQTNDNPQTCHNKTLSFKMQLLRELSNTVAEEANVLNKGNAENKYNVHYVGPKEDFTEKPAKVVLCELMNTKLNTLRRSEVEGGLRASLPRRGFFENKAFNSCAVVASSGALRGSNLGNFIDSHDVVLRFNDAPTKSFERDVGSKTTIRVLNSQVVTKPQYHFLTSNLYKNITLVLWDPSNYSSSLEEWLKNPEYDLFRNFMQYRRQEDKPRIFLVNPLTIWDLWDFLQRNVQGRLRKNPPSSGFLGLRLLLPNCNFIDVIEYVPSSKLSKRCHYYDLDVNSACTFGVWHPLAAEKLIAYHLNEANDHEVFQRGYVRIRGFGNLNC